MSKRTRLYETHIALGAKMVDFSGWDMPLHYGSQIDEHHQIRRNAGMFDVSHMGVVDLRGARVRDFLRYLLANDVASLSEPGRAMYSCMLNTAGGVIDDLIVYMMGDTWCRLVVNAGTREKDVTWITKHADSYGVQVIEPEDMAVLAVQGPAARDNVHAVLDKQVGDVESLRRFAAVDLGDVFIGRTGYTGEDGYEIIMPASEVEEFWQALLDAGVAPCGLGARDTLRLEAGMSLYGQDMDETTSPLEAGLGWTVAWEPSSRDFIGRKALDELRESGVPQKLVGLVLEDKGVLRAHQKVILNGGEGVVTSGSFSPTLERAIALARVPVGDETQCEVEVRGRRLAARIVRPVFVRNGRSCLDDNA
ncbi:MAG: glycine cleavage system aminomethyltransferase GcvT [Gammaproteobacteria bacterium]|nr:glycine cleavage system aminomethyltransferase GcvT [Gammaproteobacteria bacterium]